MKNFKTTLLLAIVLLFGCLTSSAFSQEVCEDGVCPRTLPAMVDTVVATPIRVATAPVRAVIREQPVRRWVASRPLRRVFGIFNCR